MSRLRAAALATPFAGLALLAAPTPALAGEFIDTRLTFVLTDDDVLHGAGETTPSSPSPRIGASKNSTVFFDNYETRYSGFESLSNLVLYKKEKGFFTGTDVEGALHLVFNPAVGISESSSYIRVAWRAPSWSEKEGLSLTTFPISADRFRLGYSYRLSWGGTPVFPRSRNAAPGAKLQLDKGPVYAFFGLKTSPILNEATSEEETNYGWMGGAGWDVFEQLRVEAGAGYFQRGVIPETGEATVAYGGSGQATWHVGMPIGTSVDFKLYKNDPVEFERTFFAEKYDEKLSWSVGIEATYLRQLLQDPDSPGSTTYQPAMAGDLQLKAKYGKGRAHVTGSYRELAFVLFNVPSFSPFTDFSKETEIEPELFVSGGFDWFFESIHMTPGVIAGVQFPAAVSTEVVLAGSNQADVLLGTRTVVVRDEGRFTILPAGDDAQMIFSAKLTDKVDLSESFAAVAEVFYVYDPNKATISQNEPGGELPVRTYEDPDQLGFNVVLQARF